MAIKEALKISKPFDEFYTPREAILPILKYLKQTCGRVLCPFDTKDSNYVKVLKEDGFDVSYRHIINNDDFFELTKEQVKYYDYIISNPPFSIKDQVLEKLYELDRPFIMLLPLTALEGKKRGELFRKYGIDLIIFDKRIAFIKGKSNWFNSSYFTWKVLNKDHQDNKIIFETL